MQPLKHLCDNLLGDNSVRSVSSDQQLPKLTSNGLVFNVFLIGSEDHQFRTSSSRGIAKKFLEIWMLASMVGKENVEILD